MIKTLMISIGKELNILINDTLNTFLFTIIWTTPKN